MSVCTWGRMPVKASQRCCGRVFAKRRWLDDTEGVPGPKLQEEKGLMSYLHNGCWNLTWRRFRSVPKAGNWSGFGWEKQTNWGCGRLLSTGRSPSVPPTCSSMPKVVCYSFCPRWNILGAQARGSGGGETYSLVAHAAAGAIPRQVHYSVLCLQGTRDDH